MAWRTERNERNESGRKRSGLRVLVATAGLLGLAALPANARSTKGAATATATWTARPSAVVASRDASGAPTFVWAAAGEPVAPFVASTPSARAGWLLARHAPTLGLPAAALAAAEVTAVHDLGRGGTIVAFGQHVGDVPVFRTELKMLLDRSGRLVAIGGNLDPDASPGMLARGPGFTRVAPAQALARAIVDRTGVAAVAADFAEAAGSDAKIARFRLATRRAATRTLRLVDDATVRKVIFPIAHRLVPAYQVELLAEGGDAWRLVVAADDGRVLYRQDLTDYDKFSYRVWADPVDTRPLDGPQADFMPHPTGVPDGSEPAFIAPNLITMESFNHAPGGAVDPWLPAGATETRGNNVDAYTDDNAPDGFSAGDLRASVTAAGVFDRVYDTARGPLVDQTQEESAVTQLFYVTNWMHDWWYDSGFDEASKNAQASNYGRGGVENDPLRAEAQDQARDTPTAAAARDNANMSTFSDGTSPRMQMYLWTGKELVNQVEVPSIGLSPGHVDATFGPSTYDVTAPAVVVNDGETPGDDGCSAISANLTGKIALIARGTCNFAVKAQNAENAHALAAVILNNDTEPPDALGQADPPITVHIPTVLLLQADGVAVRNAAGAGSVTIHLKRATDVERDGSLDNGIVAHEWGHYLHHRLTHCDTTQQCGAMSEGWADFNALLMSVHEGDAIDGVFVVGAYATAAFGDYGYFGIRRYPYSTDMSKNPLTFHNISDEVALPDESVAPRNGGGPSSEVHNAGEIWAAMMFEAYMGLVAETRAPSPRYGFDEARRRMSNYVVAGMKLTPVDATYTEQRDAILAAARAADPDDFLVLARAFAKRGAGSGAVSPPRDSTNLNGVVESFEIKANHALGAVALAEDAVSCDSDDVLDSGETGTLTVHVLSSGAFDLEGSTMTVSSPTPGVSFPAGASFAVPTLAPFAAADLAVAVKLDVPFVGPDAVELDYTLTNPDAANPSVTGKLLARVDYDNLPQSSATDDVESDLSVWTPTVAEGDVPVETWSRVELGALDHAWHGIDQGALADASLESPALAVGNEPFKVSFKHHYSFEADATTLWDGGVVELSTDGGASWVDVSATEAHPDPGYTGTLDATSLNPLGGRKAYSKQNSSFPGNDTVTLDFGTSLAGKTVELRFRVGSDLNAGADGWTIDDIAFTGLTGTPFATVVSNTCTKGALANAGPDQMVPSGAAVALDGSASSDVNALPLTFTWMQTAGPAVTLTGADSAKPTFTAPTVTEPTTLAIVLIASDGATADADKVLVLVSPEGGDGGCGCGVGGRRGGAGGTLPVWLLTGAAFVIVARRKRRVPNR
jgi:hypothetical protein